VPRFALHGAGQDSQFCPHCRGIPCRGLVLANGAGLGYPRAGLKAQPATGDRKGFLPARSDRVCTPGVR
jgi:hypothetical protein